jgi:hypothetical protein
VPMHAGRIAPSPTPVAVHAAAVKVRFALLGGLAGLRPVDRDVPCWI